MGLLELAWFVTFGWAELPGVLWVLPDSYLDVPNKDYGGEFVNDFEPNGIFFFCFSLSFFIPWCLIYLIGFYLCFCSLAFWYQGICLLMGKSYQDRSLGTVIGSSQVGTGLAHDSTGVEKQCRLRGESQCKPGLKTWMQTISIELENFLYGVRGSTTFSRYLRTLDTEFWSCILSGWLETNLVSFWLDVVRNLRFLSASFLSWDRWIYVEGSILETLFGYEYIFMVF